MRRDRRGWLICAESGIGLGAILLGGVMLWAGADRTIALPRGGWAALAAAWWLAGWAMRETVLELRRDPDHLNLLIGPRRE